MRSPDSAFTVNVSDLLAHPGEQRSWRVETPADYGADLARTDPDAPLRGDFVLRSIPGGIMVSADVAAPSRLICYRCLTEWAQEEHVRLMELVSATADVESDYQVDGDVVDLEPIVRDEVTLALPLLPLCREDCAGLCPTCGADLNTDACPGHDEAFASPFAALRDLFETQD